MPAANDIWQFSLHAAYKARLKDGGPPVAFLTSQGTHGIGVFEIEEEDDEEDSDSDTDSDKPPKPTTTTTTTPSLPNDMIHLDNTTYTIGPTGLASPASKSDTLPFVMITSFQPTSKTSPPIRTTKSQLLSTFHRTSKNTPVPFRMTGTFKYINTQQQTYWDERGTIFGYAVPGWQRDVSGEGVQAVFLSEDKRRGGRVLDFETGEGVVVEWVKAARLHLGFPGDEEFDELRL